MSLFHRVFKILLPACVFLVTTGQVMAQRINDDEYNSEFSFGVMAHPRGLGIDLRFGRFISSNRVEYLEAEFLTIRNPKEIRIWNTRLTNTNPYTFGKQYSAYAARLGYGNKFMITEKKLKNSASISFNVAAGPVFAVLKPVYLDLLETDFNNNNYIVSVKVQPEANINQANVIGNSPFSRGFSELDFRLGGFAKAGFNFDWGDFTDEIKAVEVGVFVDAFPKRLPLMLYTENKYIYPSFYICAVFGNKW